MMPGRSRSAVRSALLPAPGVAGLRDLLALAKPRLSGMVVSTAAAGMWLAPVRLSAARAAAFLAGTGMVVVAANVLNNYRERDVDARMRRTRDRPLPAGRVEPGVALAIGLVLPAFALPLLALAANPETALLAATALVTYAFVYTPLKRVTSAALSSGPCPAPSRP